ncbi:ground-like domain protein [Dictyocaulus viviparus]|uniref:Ground-like domain protein n=1 Tax=Dictyocaulus viviparus TaxID=29172 RepID=A0A0D8XW86_DICVI|nr:ground-like domain protein [Dictyocaulus viviparus]
MIGCSHDLYQELPTISIIKPSAQFLTMLKLSLLILIINVTYQDGLLRKWHQGAVYKEQTRQQIPLNIRQQSQIRTQGFDVVDKFKNTNIKYETPPTKGEGLTRYYYPPHERLPLEKCFYNPSGYVCCNEELNELILKTYAELQASSNFNSCNLQKIANLLQLRSETKFNKSFETIVGFDDFAQKVHFNGDLICKVKLNGRFMLAYATARDVHEEQLSPIGYYANYTPIAKNRYQLNPANVIRI